MNREKLEEAIHFRTISEPCCGNCRFFYRAWEDTECENPENCWFPDGYPDDVSKLSYIHEADICDRFERKEENKNVLE